MCNHQAPAPACSCLSCLAGMAGDGPAPSPWSNRFPLDGCKVGLQGSTVTSGHSFHHDSSAATFRSSAPELLSPTTTTTTTRDTHGPQDLIGFPSLHTSAHTSAPSPASPREPTFPLQRGLGLVSHIQLGVQAGLTTASTAGVQQANRSDTTTMPPPPVAVNVLQPPPVICVPRPGEGPASLSNTDSDDCDSSRQTDESPIHPEESLGQHPGEALKLPDESSRWHPDESPSQRPDCGIPEPTAVLATAHALNIGLELGVEVLLDDPAVVLGCGCSGVVQVCLGGAACLPACLPAHRPPAFPNSPNPRKPSLPLPPLPPV